jgi:hypothetical protein
MGKDSEATTPKDATPGQSIRANARTSVAIYGLAIASLLGLILWFLLASGTERPNGWAGVGVTAAGLVLAGWAGTCDRNVDQGDRRDECLATLGLAVAAVLLFSGATEDVPPIWMILLFVPAAVTEVRERRKPRSEATLEHRGHREALTEAVKGPVPWRGLTLTGVLIASSAFVYDKTDTESARQQVLNICNAVERPQTVPRSCAEIARDIAR